MDNKEYNLDYIFQINTEDLTWQDYLRGLHVGRKYNRVVNGKVMVLEEEYVQSYWISNTYIIVAIVVAYLAFVLKLGPKFMENRKPMKLKYLMLLYNLTQVFLNILGVYVFFSTKDILPYIYHNACHKDPAETNPVRILLVHGAHWGLTLKVMDLLDTVFMVLRKKNNHISYLHLYHHTSMVINMWYSIRIVRDEAGFFLYFVNTLIHIVMYSYYFICALGPRYSKIVHPYKNIVTQLQLGQFVLMLLMLATFLLQGCEVERDFILLWVFNIVVFLILFLNFYIKNYTVKKYTDVTSKKAH